MLNKTHLKTLCGSIILGCVAALSAPAYANGAMLDLLKILRDKGSITAEEYELLVNAAQADQEKEEGIKQEAKQVAEEAAAEKVKDIPEIDTKGKLEITSQDVEFSWRIGGRLQHDATWWNADGLTDASYKSGNEFRRARLYASGTVWQVWDFKFEYDFTDTDASMAAIEDAYVRYTGWQPFTVTVGQQKAPFSLNEMTSSKYITFIERSLVVDATSAIVGNRRPGIHLHHYFHDQFTLAGSVSLNRPDNDGAPETLEGEYAITGRATWSPVHNDHTAVHLGAAGGYRNLDGRAFRVRTRPEVHIADRPVDQDGVPADSVTAVGLEGALVYGPFSLQGEYVSFDLDETVAGDGDGDGYYIYGSWFLTGDQRRYNWKGGNFKSVNVKRPLGKGGFGAWEIGVRFSTLDIDDSASLGLGNDGGGEIDNFTGALNWYVNNNIMFRLNYIKTLDCSFTCEDGFGGTIREEPSAVTLRTQVFF